MNEHTTHHYIPLDDAMPRPGPLLRWFGGAIAVAAMLGAVAIAVIGFMVGLALWPLLMAWTWLARRSVSSAIVSSATSTVEVGANDDVDVGADADAVRTVTTGTGAVADSQVPVA